MRLCINIPKCWDDPCWHGWNSLRPMCYLTKFRYALSEASCYVTIRWHRFDTFNLSSELRVSARRLLRRTTYQFLRPLTQWAGMHSTMLSFSLNEAARRGAWTCGSCSTIPRTYQAWFNNSARSLPVRSRRYSSSKPSSSPKDESRAISTPSTAPAKEALAKERSDRRVNRRKSKDVGHESRGKSKDKSLPNMPSVPSTQNLKSQGIF